MNEDLEDDRKEEVVAPGYEPLSFKEKISYALGSLPNSFYGTFMGQINAFYYAWMGLSSSFIIIAQVLYGIWNMINDPIFGIMQDRTKHKDGRYIPWIKWFSPILTIGFIIVFFPPDNWNIAIGGPEYQIPLFIWYLVSQMVYDTAYTVVYIAHTALAPQMSMSQKERTSLAVYCVILSFVGLGASAYFPFKYLTNPSAELIAEFKVVIVIFAILGYIPWLLLTKNVKEKVEFIPPEETPFLESIKHVFKNKSGRIYILYDGIIIGLTNFLMGSITFILAWIFGLNNFYQEANPGWDVPSLIPYLIPIFIGLIIGIKIQFWAGKKYDIKTAISIMFIFLSIGFFLAYFGALPRADASITEYELPWNLPMISAGLCFIAMGLPGEFIFHNPMRAETIDMDEMLTGERRESVYAGVGCILSKPMISVALAVVPAVMSLYGLVKDETSLEQGLIATMGWPSAITGVATASFLIPGFLSILGFIIWQMYPIDRKKMEEIRAYLKDLHETKRNERLDADGHSKIVGSSERE
jgi:GPH family glycoside/pentoside/hexuronide:cation symporter